MNRYTVVAHTHDEIFHSHKKRVKHKFTCFTRQSHRDEVILWRAGGSIFAVIIALRFGYKNGVTILQTQRPVSVENAGVGA